MELEYIESLPELSDFNKKLIQRLRFNPNNIQEPTNDDKPLIWGQYILYGKGIGFLIL